MPNPSQHYILMKAVEFIKFKSVSQKVYFNVYLNISKMVTGQYANPTRGLRCDIRSRFNTFYCSRTK